MELRNKYVLIIGFFLLFILCLIQFKRKGDFKGGKKVAATSYMKEDPYIKRKYRNYKILSLLLMFFCLVSIGTALFLMARPYKTEVLEKETYSRDIMLCIDISTSVDNLNKDLVNEWRKTVKSLKGERFGIVIFNTSPVLLSPLTDDYEYIMDMLDTIEKSLDIRQSNAVYDEEWMYYDSYISSGTLVGNEDRGSSLIGDGLAATVYDFSELDKERTRVIIFSTDNDIQGTPYFTLDEAATICKENKTVVYGIGTKEMTTDNMNAMKAAVEKTGGKFYLEGDSGSTSQIVKDIEKQGKSLVKSHREERTVELVEVPFYLLLLFVASTIVLTKITKR